MDNLEEKYLSANKEDLDSKQVLVECIINLSSGEQVEKVLALSSDAIINNVETFEKETKFSGEIYTNLFYLTPENEIGSVTSTCPFSDTIKHDTLAEGQKVKADVKVVSVNPTSVNENTFKVMATVEVTLTLEENTQINMFKNTNANNCVLDGSFSLNVLKQDVSGNFSSEKSIVIKEGVKKVLIVDSNAVLRQVDQGTGFVSVQGDVYTYLVYAKQDGTLTHTQIVTPFKEELEVENANKESLIEAYLKVKKAETTATLTEKEEGTELLVTTQLTAYLRVYENQEYTCVNDIYSLTNELEVSKTAIANVKVLPAKYFEGKVEGNLTLDDNQPRIDKVLSVSAPRLMLSNYYVKDDEVYVEGVINSNVIYLNDEENSINSVEIEVPFSTSEKLSTEIKDLETKVQVALSDCDVIAKRGREIYFDCKVNVFANLWHKEVKEVITKVDEGRTFDAKDSAIEIYFAKTGDTAWDIAKELRVTTDVLMGQNPTLVSPLENSEKVVVYYGLD